MKMLCVIAICLASPALAIVVETPPTRPPSPPIDRPSPALPPGVECKDGQCSYTPPEPRPVPPSDDRDPAPVFVQPGQMPCCVRDGAILWHAPLNLDRAGVRAFCAVQPIDQIPACKSWVRK